ncbi:STAS domain-containing protein [Streptomyces sp. NPDC016845]|uniref:STAS domain-containing protein n=1 Tax=Streptomyces sp. NPDC016845 TaxID=3364972 RepID=UPI0037888F84
MLQAILNTTDADTWGVAVPDHASCAAPPVPRAAAGLSHAAAAASVRLEVRPLGLRTLVAVHGEVDLETAPGFEHDLRSALNDSARGLELDLQALRFCDCAGLGVLLRVRRTALATGKPVTVRSASPLVARLLQVTGTHALFTDVPVPAVSTAALPQQPTPAAPQLSMH